MALPPSNAMEDQARLLEDALGVVRQQSVMMRRCLETPGKLMDALKCGSTLVAELRTPSLGPKQYYELYMAVFDALRYLSVYLKESHPVNHLADLYELVQYAGNIVPRLYLMVTVGTVYMSIPDAPVKEIMKDMMEMSRGVQHPIRGLFLRYYLLGQAKDHLPTGDGDGPEGNLLDSVNFVLTNFVEMNKLWVRLQHQGHSRDREHRTQERKELELLVGSNLVRLSQLVDLNAYKNVILQPLLEQVVNCRDVLAQEYLLEVMTKVFPDEYHLHTLDMLLHALARLNPNVDVKKILIGLMDRLSTYALRDNDPSAENPKAKLKTEEEAVVRLLSGVKLSEDSATATEPAKSGKPAASPPAGDALPSPSAAAAVEATAEATGSNGTAVPADTNGSLSPSDGPAGASGDRDTASADAGTTGTTSAAAPASATSTPDLPNTIKLYDIFYEQVVNLVRARNLSVQDTVALLVSLAYLSLSIYPAQIGLSNLALASPRPALRNEPVTDARPITAENINQILGYAEAQTKVHLNSSELHSAAFQPVILNLLLAPIRSYQSIFTALALPNYAPLFAAQTYTTRRAVAGEIARSLLKNRTAITTQENLERVMSILGVLIQEGQQTSPVRYAGLQPQRRGETDETIEEQGWLARIVHYIQGPDNDTQLEVGADTLSVSLWMC
ncbi:Vacuolar protein sorting-associated protein 35 [Ascosphaera acerosa]|nr:Vacuolar protein sorting-associated protein 35 [Ascosphaera acerosa]